ncbi:MAG: hypothetical protein JXR96_09960 [Deltaproteobacteria bacterium]|nr:hypothetical protein [Deltaproteobacteria bacterium]
MSRFIRTPWRMLLAALVLSGCHENDAAETRAGHGPAEKPPAQAEQPGKWQPVARGLKGLSFGMSPAQARKALGKEPGDDGLALRLITEYHVSDRLKTPEELPGEAFWVETRLGTQPAACWLEFKVEGGLSRMACKLGGVDSQEIFVSLRERLHETLVRKYGPPQESTGEADTFWIPDRSWVWRDHAARLELRASFNNIMPKYSQIELRNDSIRHLEAVERYREQEKRRQEAAEAEARRKQEEELRKLQRTGEDAFERDL